MSKSLQNSVYRTAKRDLVIIFCVSMAITGILYAIVPETINLSRGFFQEDSRSLNRLSLFTAPFTILILSLVFTAVWEYFGKRVKSSKELKLVNFAVSAVNALFLTVSTAYDLFVYDEVYHISYRTIYIIPVFIFSFFIIWLMNQIIFNKILLKRQ